MKKLNKYYEGIISIVLFAMLIIPQSCGKGSKKAQKQITISGANALYPMMLVWADKYEKKFYVEFQVSGGGAGKGVSDCVNEQTDIGMVSRPIRPEELDQGVRYFAVVKDAVIATINENNPVADKIMQQGMSNAELEDIFTKKTKYWKDKNGENLAKIVVYGRSDASGAAKIWASFLGNYTQSDLQNNADANYNGDQPLAEAVKKEKYAIGFNNVNYVYDINTGQFVEGIRPIPLDLNGDGTLSSAENFYGERSELIENISKGKYPSPPARRDYVICKGTPGETEYKFIKWILTEGQQYVKGNGYVNLSENTIQAQLDKLEKLYSEN